jgi:hypothetical protein
MSEQRQKNRLVLAFTEKARSEAPKASQEGNESRTAKCEPERPASHERLNRPMRTRMSGGVAGATAPPMSIVGTRKIYSGVRVDNSLTIVRTSFSNCA